MPVSIKTLATSIKTIADLIKELNEKEHPSDLDLKRYETLKQAKEILEDKLLILCINQ